MSPPAITRPATPTRVHHKVGLAAGAVAVVLAAAVALNFLAGFSAEPGTIPRITFENPTVYALDIEVSPGTESGWMSAGSVRQLSTADVQEVIDQGDVWLFRFDSQGHTGGTLQLTRADLEGSGWHVAIPTEVGARLAAAGAPPTP